MNEIWVTICGNVVDEPRHRPTARGTLTGFRLASSSWVKGEQGWGSGPTSFFDVTCFNRLADNVAASVTKGQPVIVSGRLQVRDWNNGERTGRTAEIVANHVGHDLGLGTSMFRKAVRASADAEVAGPAGPVATEPVAHPGPSLAPVADPDGRSGEDAAAPAA